QLGKVAIGVEAEAEPPYPVHAGDRLRLAGLRESVAGPLHRLVSGARQESDPCEVEEHLGLASWTPLRQELQSRLDAALSLPPVAQSLEHGAGQGAQTPGVEPEQLRVEAHRVSPVASLTRGDAASVQPHDGLVRFH